MLAIFMPTDRIKEFIFMTLPCPSVSQIFLATFIGNGEGDVFYAEEILQTQLKAFPKVLQIIFLICALIKFGKIYLKMFRVCQ